ncbi:MAG: hypothetical protein ACF8LK_06800 [Phycisphaerales bacterium JB041]
MTAESLAWILAVHAAATWIMTGLIWFVQLVHYPLMARVGREGWTDYERAHQARTTWIVAPVMLVEVLSAVWLLIAAHSEVGPPEVSAAVPALWVSASLLVVVWASTFLIQVPLHARLSGAYSDRAHALLVRSNWLRTAAWTGRAVLLVLVVHSALT